MKFVKITFLFTFILFFVIITNPLVIRNIKADNSLPEVKINIPDFSTVYEGDIINCTITGNPTMKCWKINNQSSHYSFFEDSPVIFDPESTPLGEEYVNLTVIVENSFGNSSETVRILLKKLFFGDIHWHMDYGDGIYTLDEMYKNTVEDNYLDFAASTEHKMIGSYYKEDIPFGLLKFIFDKLKGVDFWDNIKEKAIEYYDPGNFTTLLGFEYSVYPGSPGGYLFSPNGREDVSHINFYYRDVYSDALRFSGFEKFNYEDILKAMAQENERGHLNIGFPHHPLGRLYFRNNGLLYYSYTVNWAYLANDLKNPENRDKILRGVEVYSRWGTSIGKYSGIPISWPYIKENDEVITCLDDRIGSWVESALWEWSSIHNINSKFVMQAGSDTHMVDRAGSAELDKLKPSGIIAAYAVHNTRGEIWDAMDSCEIYGSQLLKIRANVRFDDQMALGKWMNCSSPLKIKISVYSTFNGLDNNSKNMSPHGYSSDELNHPISDIWIIKKDAQKCKPWCKIIYHAQPGTNLAVVDFEDSSVQPNDFYYIAIRQKGEELRDGQGSYMAFLGPVFINEVD